MTSDFNKSLQINDDDHKYIKKLKKALANNINLKSANWINDSVHMANCFVALGERAKAINFLKNYSKYTYEQAGDMDIWGSIAQGIILLAWLYGESGKKEKQKGLIKKIEEKDYVFGDKSDYLYEKITTHEEELEFAKQETKKWAIQAISQHILELLYLKEFLFAIDVEDANKSGKELGRLISESYAEIKKLLD